MACAPFKSRGMQARDTKPVSTKELRKVLEPLAQVLFKRFDKVSRQIEVLSRQITGNNESIMANFGEVANEITIMKIALTPESVLKVGISPDGIREVHEEEKGGKWTDVVNWNLKANPKVAAGQRTTLNKNAAQTGIRLFVGGAHAKVTPQDILKIFQGSVSLEKVSRGAAIVTFDTKENATLAKRMHDSRKHPKVFVQMIVCDVDEKMLPRKQGAPPRAQLPIDKVVKPNEEVRGEKDAETAESVPQNNGGAKEVVKHRLSAAAFFLSPPRQTQQLLQNRVPLSLQQWRLRRKRHPPQGTLRLQCPRRL